MAFISNIQHLSTSDGPGIRSTVFLMGCSLRCSWCHNPENFLSTPVLSYNASSCIGCGNCLDHCPKDALSLVSGKISVDRLACDNCGQCVAYCYQGALELKGRQYSEEQLLNVLVKYKPYYQASTGGVTFSGGEPLLHQAFLRRMITLLRENDIDVIVETSLAVNLELATKQALQACSQLFVDIKKLSSSEHTLWTGSGNALIFENIKALDKLGIPMLLRTPVVPGVNDSEEEIVAIANFVRTLEHAKGYQLIPYHPLGLAKYEQIGLEAPFKVREYMDKETFEELTRSAENVMSARGERT